MGAALGEIHVEGLRELSRAFAAASPHARKELRKVLKEVAGPVKQRAEMLSIENFSHLREGDKWAVARIGVTQREVYVVPKERGVSGRRGLVKHSRPMFGAQMMVAAFEPALEQNRRMIVREFDAMLNRVAERINAA